jgi:hypothetical protein
MLFTHHAIDRSFSGDYGEYFSSETVRPLARSGNLVTAFPLAYARSALPVRITPASST